LRTFPFSLHQRRSPLRLSREDQSLIRPPQNLGEASSSFPPTAWVSTFFFLPCRTFPFSATSLSPFRAPRPPPPRRRRAPRDSLDKPTLLPLSSLCFPPLLTGGKIEAIFSFFTPSSAPFFPPSLFDHRFLPAFFFFFGRNSFFLALQAFIFPCDRVFVLLFSRSTGCPFFWIREGAITPL